MSGERPFTDGFGGTAYQDIDWIHVPKSALVCPAGVPDSLRWTFTPAIENGNHELQLALLHRWNLFQPTSEISEITYEPFIKTTEYISGVSYFVYRRGVVVRIEDTTANIPSPSQLILNHP